MRSERLAKINHELSAWVRTAEYQARRLLGTDEPWLEIREEHGDCEVLSVVMSGTPGAKVCLASIGEPQYWKGFPEMVEYIEQSLRTRYAVELAAQRGIDLDHWHQFVRSLRSEESQALYALEVMAG